MKRVQKDARRGVLLLVILALLAMFGLVAVAFVMLTSQERRSARIIQRIDQQSDPPRQVLRQALLEALRGSYNPQSAIGAHSLLEDMYGNDAYALGSFSTAPTSRCGGQLFEFPIPTNDTWPGRAAFRTGCVLTMLTGPAAGQSTHIVGINPMYPTAQFYQARAFETGALPTSATQYPMVYMINGVPFSGTGFGYEPNATGSPPTFRVDAKVDKSNPDQRLLPSDPKWSQPQSAWELALLPNSSLNRNLPGSTVPFGGANSDYTAVDYQHMLLGTPALANPMVFSGGSGPINGASNIPSLHRPELVNYWLKRTNTSAQVSDWQQPMWASPMANSPWSDPSKTMNLDLQRRVIMRPLPIDHPNFTGSNSLFNPILGPWDVDNDGDGIPDSVWVDLGLPVRSAPDGRLYKPLCAILCVDMDGRLNLNAHGLLAQTDRTAYPMYYNGAGTDELPVGSNVLFAGAPATSPMLPRGQGYGPAEISLFSLFWNGNPAPTDVNNALNTYKGLLQGAGALDGRYAELSGDPRPGRSGTWDPLTCNKWFDFWNFTAQTANYWGFFTADPNYRLNAWGAPPDLQGYGAVGLDLAGRPLYLSMGAVYDSTASAWQPDIVKNTPYSMKLSRNVAHGLSSPTTAADNPFSVAELERLLRPFDRDSSTLPLRLAALTYNSATGRSWLVDKRQAITTESWDLPCPPAAVPWALLRSGNLTDFHPRHLTDLLVAAGVPPSVWSQLLPPEVLAGERMNINRPYCSGWDVTNSGHVVPTGNETVALFSGPATTATPNFNYFNGCPSGAVPSTPQELQARYLYVLATLLVDRKYLGAALNDATTGEKTSRLLAQWAVNVVDFQDRDSVMTRFPYVVVPLPADPPAPAPPAPFVNGWNPSGNDVVWGCERPELLISETLAFHDRRTEDLDGFNNPDATLNKKTTAPAPADPDYDQKKVPQGSLFVELYNPQSPLDPATGDLYDYTTAAANRRLSGVSLTQTHNGKLPSDPTDPGHPVWRMIVVKIDPAATTGQQPDPDDPDPTKRPPIVNTTTNSFVERSIYFVDMSTLPAGFSADNGDVMFFPSAAANTLAPVLPGRYTVIGPGGPNPAPGNQLTITYIGERPDKDWAQTRRIVLSSSSDPGSQQVDIQTNRQSSGSDLAIAPVVNAIKPATAVVIDRAKSGAGAAGPRRLSVSEPVSGYPKVDTSGQAYNEATGGFPTPYDHPFDGPLAPADPKADPADVQALSYTGTTFGFRMIHLQRLANPLAPYNAATNPYRTVDSMPVDVTAFNGVTSIADPTEATNPKTLPVVFKTRQRGETADKTMPDTNNLWKQEPSLDSGWRDAIAATFPQAGSHVFQQPFAHTFGYLNRTFGDPKPEQTVGQIDYHTGDPMRGPFPWLTWNNRPFVSQLELLLVPALQSSRLFSPDGAVRQYYNFVTGVVNPYFPADANQIPYPHLLNFFQSDTSSAATPASAQFHRLLEYLTVPSRFAGTEIQINPMVFSTPDATPLHAFYPPFNRIPLMREPGRINLNTIFDEAVLRGLVDPNMVMSAGDFTAFVGKFVQSRRGDAISDPTKNNTFLVDDDLPTVFAHPFRSFAGAEKVPWDPNNPPGSLNPTILKREVEATIMRSDPQDATAAQPLLEWVAQKQSSGLYNNTDRNPYFRYQALQRMGNLATTRSNVFAMWITVGYFEVARWPAGVDQQHPDGYQLGQEMGSDTGEIERHRAFFIIDRTIPVGFQRGQDFNVENTLLLQRYIE